MEDVEWSVTAIDDAPGHVLLGVYEIRKDGEPGKIIKIDLTLFEMEQMHEALTKALWFHIRTLSA